MGLVPFPSRLTTSGDGFSFAEGTPVIGIVIQQDPGFN
jgi:hypothetical protein